MGCRAAGTGRTDSYFMFAAIFHSVWIWYLNEECSKVSFPDVSSIPESGISRASGHIFFGIPDAYGQGC